jgi:hypothetical protein
MRLFRKGAQSADGRSATLLAYRQPGGAAACGAVLAVPADADASELGTAASAMAPSAKATAIDVPVGRTGIPSPSSVGQCCGYAGRWAGRSMTATGTGSARPLTRRTSVRAPGCAGAMRS